MPELIRGSPLCQLLSCGCSLTVYKCHKDFNKIKNEPGKCHKNLNKTKQKKISGEYKSNHITSRIQIRVHTREWIVEITKIFTNKVDIIFADPDLGRAAEAFRCQLCIKLIISSLLLNVHATQTTSNTFHSTATMSISQLTFSSHRRYT